jgi:uncharacterized membrane protein
MKQSVVSPTKWTSRNRGKVDLKTENMFNNLFFLSRKEVASFLSTRQLPFGKKQLLRPLIYDQHESASGVDVDIVWRQDRHQQELDRI